MAWFAFGLNSILQTLYWLQIFYYYFAFGGKQAETNVSKNMYNWWGVAETVNIFILFF